MLTINSQNKFPPIQPSNQPSSLSLLWYDENIYDEYNQNCFNKLKSFFSNSKRFQSLDEGFDNFYLNDNQRFKITLVIVSGKLFGRYVKKIKDNVNKIINIPFTFILLQIILKVFY